MRRSTKKYNKVMSDNGVIRIHTPHPGLGGLSTLAVFAGMGFIYLDRVDQQRFDFFDRFWIDTYPRLSAGRAKTLPHLLFHRRDHHLAACAFRTYDLFGFLFFI
jgi:hypothetical protein